MTPATARPATEMTPPVPVAIIGLGCLFPKAEAAPRFWANVRDGVDAIAEVPPTHWRPEDYFDPDPKAPDRTYARRGGFLDPVDFAPLDFGLSPNQLEATDTTQLLGLVAARQALADAGYGPGRDFDRSRVSVLLGVTGTLELVIPLAARLGHPLWRKALEGAGVDRETADAVVKQIAEGYVGWQEDSFPGLLGNVVAGRISNRLDLGGTNCVVDAACASSLGAVHLALLELASGRSDMVLTGGMDTFNDIFMYMCFSKTPALSPTGDARPFASGGDGTILGEGLGCLVLKRLDDAERDGDKIYAVIRSVGSSSDGKGHAIYAPSSEGQTRALREAYRLAGVTPDTIELVEGHGTGTLAGDKAEAAALAEVYGGSGREGSWCALGSVKSQIGHTKAAAGAAGLIKAALALHHKVLPPTIKVDRPIESLAPGTSPFYLNTEKRPWLPAADHPRRAAVSAFGFGGSNYHCVLEEYGSDKSATDWDGDVEIIAVSAETGRGIDEALAAWPSGLLWDGVRREAARSRAGFDPSHEHRLVIVAERSKEKIDKVIEGAKAVRSRGASSGNVYYGIGPAVGDLALLFPGQGAQYPGMFRDLACRFPEMQRALAEADAAFAEDNEGAGHRRLSDVIYPHPSFDRETRVRDEEALRATEVAQPALGAVALGAVGILDRFGIKPGAVAGHSYGELPSLCAAGRFDSETLHRLSRLRGRSMAEGSGDRGAMLAVLAPRDTIEAVLGEDELSLVVANKNAPRQSVLSGASSEIARAREAFRSREIEAVPLSVSAAFHSPFVAEARWRFSAALEGVEIEAGMIPVFANTTGDVYPDDPDRARDLLAGQLAEPVEFVTLIENMHRAGFRTFLEVGPGSRLTGLVNAILKDRPHAAFSVDATGGSRGGMVDLARSLAGLAALGHAVDLVSWEEGNAVATAEPGKKPTLTIPISGANYVKPKAPAGPNLEPAPTPAPARRVADAPASNGSHRNGSANGHPAPTFVPPAPTRIAEPAPVPVASAILPGLAALQELGEQTARLHRQFLEGQDRALQVFQTLLGQMPLVASSTTQAGPSGLGMIATSAANPAPPSRKTDEIAKSPLPTSDPLPPRGEGLGWAEASPDRPDVTPRPTPPPTLPSPTRGEGRESARKVEKETVGRAPERHAESTLLAVVAEKTGYPTEMLDLNMEIEADLGIDSIKRVEIFGALSERLPDAPAIRAEHLGTLRTLRQVVEFLGSSSAPVAEVRASAPERGGDRDRAVSTLLGVVAEKTGYPPEMLDLNMEIEADLGIDSIKRVEIFGALSERLPDAPAIRAEHLGSLRTLAQVADFLAGPSAPVNPPIPGNGRAASTLLAIVAEKTGYPPEMLDLNMEIEADLGIDSIKRVEIFGALAERLPEAPTIRAEQLGTLRTLKQVAAFLDGAPTEAPAPVAKENGQQAAPVVEVAGIGRYLVEPVPLGDRAAAGLAEGGDVWITDDGAGLSARLADRLASRGFRPKIVDGRPGLLGPTTLAGMVIVARPGSGDDGLRDALRLLRLAGPGLRASGTAGGSTLLTVARLDGAFGLRGMAADADPTAGGLAGFAKTAGHEWPEVRCRAIDVDPTLIDLDFVADAIVDEMFREGPNEVGIGPSGRLGLTLREARLTGVGSGRRIEPGDLVVVTGGARGVTAEVAVALAGSLRPTLVLLGRSAPPEAEPAWLAPLVDESAIKRALLASGTAGTSPREIEAGYRRIAANREALRNLARIVAAGSKVVYRQVDVRDAGALSATLAEIRQAFGPVRGLIHGAGVLADARIEDKSVASFDQVYGTKVDGLRSLLGAIPESDGLEVLVLFSSSTARFGRLGQVDYAAANEVLNKMAGVEANRRPGCRVVSVNWGPWDGGMVTPALKKVFASEGVGLIPADAGAAYLVREIAEGADGPVEVVILGGDGPPPNPPAPVASTVPMSVVFGRELTLDSMPVLRSHAIDGRAVLPMAITMEWLGHAAIHGNPGLAFAGVEGLRVHRGVFVEAGRAYPIRVLAGKATRRDGLFVVPTELRGGPADAEVVHARADVILANAPPAAVAVGAAPALGPYGRSIESLYEDVLFHGPAMRGIARVEGCSGRGIAVSVSAAPSPAEWLASPPRGAWLADPLAIDAAFQAMIVWSVEQHGAGSLPCFLARYRQYRRTFPRDGLRVVATVVKDTPTLAVADIDILDASGSVVATLEGYECVVDASLNAAFRRNRVER